MKAASLQIDERTITNARKISTKLYFFMLSALWVDVCGRQFILGQSLSEFVDLAALTVVNIFLFVGAILVCGGVTVRKIRASTVARFYCACIVAGAALTIFKYRSSSALEILWRILLIAAVAGVLVLLFVSIAYWSARKADRQLEE
jgi:hypothetical protein